MLAARRAVRHRDHGTDQAAHEAVGEAGAPHLTDPVAIRSVPTDRMQMGGQIFTMIATPGERLHVMRAGQDPCRVLERCQSDRKGQSPTDPWRQERLRLGADIQAIPIRLAAGMMDGVPVIGHARHATADDSHGQMSCQCAVQLGAGPRARAIDVRHLAACMDTRIGATGADRRCMRFTNAGESRVEVAGDAACLGLPPPAGEGRPVISQQQGKTRHALFVAICFSHATQCMALPRWLCLAYVWRMLGLRLPSRHAGRLVVTSGPVVAVIADPAAVAHVVRRNFRPRVLDS